MKLAVETQLRVFDGERFVLDFLRGISDVIYLHINSTSKKETAQAIGELLG